MRLDTMERPQHIDRLGRQIHLEMMCSRLGWLMIEHGMKGILKERERETDRGLLVNQELQRISKEEVRSVMYSYGDV